MNQGGQPGFQSLQPEPDREQAHSGTGNDSTPAGSAVSQSEQLYMENTRYQQLFQKLAREEEQLHALNQKRIKVGIQCLIWIPMLFLILLLLTESEKAIFLVLWIISLFITASCLIYIEYMDFQSQERLRSYTDQEGMAYSHLIGGDMEAFEETVTELLRQIDAKKASNREKMLRMLGHPTQTDGHQ